MISPLIGIFIAFGVSYFTFSGINIPIDFFTKNLVGLVIVVGGTISAATITFSFSDLWTLSISTFRIFQPYAKSKKVIIKEILEVSAMPKEQQMKITRANYHPFLVDGMSYIENGFEQSEIRGIMSNTIVERKNSLLKATDMMKTLSKYPTAFGMMGTVLGLISLMRGMNVGTGSGSATSDIGANMAIALLTTLYGLILSNWFFFPISENIFDKTQHELLTRKIILQGVLLIHKGQDPFFIQESLNSYVLPKFRSDQITLDTGA